MPLRRLRLAGPHGMFLHRYPLCVLLRNQAFHAVGKQYERIIRAHIRAGAGEVEVLLVLQGFAGAAIPDPILLILVQLLSALKDQSDESQYGPKPLSGSGAPKIATSGISAVAVI